LRHTDDQRSFSGECPRRPEEQYRQ
jgi:hypothetical protein